VKSNVPAEGWAACTAVGFQLNSFSIETISHLEPHYSALNLSKLSALKTLVPRRLSPTGNIKWYTLFIGFCDF
jgi:hypothetical protein